MTHVLKVDRLNYTILSNKSSLVPFLTGDEDQNLHVKMAKNSGKPGLNCTENYTDIRLAFFIQASTISSILSLALASLASIPSQANNTT